MQNVRAIEYWCKQHVGKKLKVTAIKDSKMHILFDERVEFNTVKLYYGESG